MPSKVDRKCRLCPKLIARETKTGLCADCYVTGQHRRPRVCRLCPTEIDRDNKTGLCRACFNKEQQAQKPSERVAADRERQRNTQELTGLRKKYEESLKTIERQEKSLKALDNLVTEGVETFKIEPRKGTGSSECTIVIPASDWHIEERVNPGTVSGLNEHNLEIARARATRFFQGGLRLTRLLQQDTTIDHVVMPLLGDFISNDIHEEFPENNELTPMLAIVEAQNIVASGIEFMLNNSKLNLTFPCHSGNHARTTRTTRFSSENGHSLEYLMYRHLAGYFRNEPRVTFIIPEGPHSYMDIYGMTVRFQHGHMIKFQGGVGGIFIPTFKAIAQWNKARRADLDVFGHFHQRKDGGNFICNGSNIGYNAFALSIKADYEEPAQQLFMIDKKRGRTCTWPILVK